MASVSTDPRNGKVVVRAYAGIDPLKKRKRWLRESLPPYASDARIADVCARLDERASFMKETGEELTLDGLVKWYLDELVGANRPPGTVKTYRSYYFRHISPRRGAMPADSVMPFMLSRDLAAAMRGDERGSIAPSTANGVRALLHAAYAAGVAEGVVMRNPVTAVPKMHVDDMDDARAFDEREVSVLSSWMSSEPMCARGDEWDGICARAAASLALDTGMRVGEVCALRMRDLRPGALRVAGSVTEAGGVHRKSTKGRVKRTVSLGQAAEASLRAHIALVAELFGGGCQWMFPDGKGELRAPSTISAQFSAACRDLGLGEGRRFHELRHTHATWLLEGGTPLKVVSERLGHASEAFTLRVYGHVLPGRDEMAARAFEETRSWMEGMHNG